MELKLRENCRYAIACPTSMGVRITPEDRMAVPGSSRVYLQATHAETQVLNMATTQGGECIGL